MLRTRLAIALGAAACASQPTSTAPANRSVRAPVAIKTTSLPPFGDFTIDDGELLLADHNNGDQRVHVMTVSRDYRGSKLSWADRPGPRTDVRTGAVPISAEERDQLHTWTQRIWPLAPAGRRSFARPPADGTPQYEWVIVMRRGDDVHVIDGGASAEPDSDITEGVLDFLDMHF